MLPTQNQATEEKENWEKASVAGNYVDEDGAVNWPGVERVYCPVHPETSYDPASLALRHGDYMDGDKVRFSLQIQLRRSKKKHPIKHSLI